jgi:amino acid transporter
LLHNTEDNLYTIEADIIQAKEDLQVAQDRVNSLQNYTTTGYYDSWFPINRPLRTSTNILCLGIGIFFFIFVFFMFLHSIGFSITTNVAHNFNDILKRIGRLLPIGYIVAGLLIILVGVAINGYLRKI